MAVSAKSHMYAVGDRVRVRRERWRVSAVDGEAACRLLTLDGLGPHNASEQRTLLEPFETIGRLGAQSPGGAPSLADLSWRSGRRRWRRAASHLLASMGSWERLRSVDAADITVWPHQLEPAIAVLRGLTTRVFLADGVGLGKTVQAGILLSELLRRGAAHSALILTPPGLREQWQQELSGRFHLQADIVDFRAAARRAWELPLGVNPWSTWPLAIASVDYVKRPEILPAVRARAWDIVIVDEAHAVGPGSDRYAALAPLCRSAVFVILLTATPHSGDRDAFAALRAIGALDPSSDDCVMFRRTHADVSRSTGRRVHVLDVRPSDAESEMHRALDRYADALRREAADDANAALLASVLRKRALSSPESLRVSIDRRLRVLASAVADADAEGPDERQLWLPLAEEDDGHGEMDAGDLAPRLEGRGLENAHRERALLERVLSTATAATAAESKLSALARLLRRLDARGEAVLVFTEYRDTLLHLQRRVAPSAAVLHGGLTRIERRAVVEAFTTGNVRVLLATDAAGEGLNLHHACRCVVHLELPWNPVRLEQRIGRVDRIGQQRTVHAYCLVARHPAELDLRRRLEGRVAAADADVGMSNPLESSRSPGHSPADVEPDARAGDDDPARAGDADQARRRMLSDAATAAAAQVRRARSLRARGGRTSPSTPRTSVPTGRSSVSERCSAAIVARARSVQRTWLCGRALLIIEVVIADDVARPVASVVLPLVVPIGSMRSTRHRASRPALTLADVARDIALRVDGAVAVMVAEVGRRYATDAEHAPFWSMVLARATCMARAASAHASDLYQPGLFDRRAERIHQLRIDERAAIAELMAQRSRQLDRASRAASASVGRALLLLP